MDRLRRSGLLGLPLLTATLLCTTVAAGGESDWERVNDKGGVLVERRAVPGSSWKEHRGTAHSDLSPEQVFAAAHSERLDDKRAQRYVKKHQVLRASDHDRLVYEQVRAPLVSDRDYTMYISWRGDSARRSYDLSFQTRNAEGPPPTPGMVRMETIRGGWHVEADPAGGSRVTYWVLSDPAGSLPAWIARGAQVDSTRDQVLDTLAYAASHPAK